MTLQEQILCFEPECEQEAEEKRMMLHYLSLFDDLLFRTNEIAHFTASSWIVDPTRTRVLMVYHNIYNSWSWTGGHADGDSNLKQVARREAIEETGLSDVTFLQDTPFSLEILSVFAHRKRGRYVVPHQHLNLTYLLQADDTQAIRSKTDENSGVKWFTLDEAIRVCTEPEMIPVYKKLNRKLLTLK